jgi:hypothetical protein
MDGPDGQALRGQLQAGLARLEPVPITAQVRLAFEPEVLTDYLNWLAGNRQVGAPIALPPVLPMHPPTDQPPAGTNLVITVELAGGRYVSRLIPGSPDVVLALPNATFDVLTIEEPDPAAATGRSRCARWCRRDPTRRRRG